MAAVPPVRDTPPQEVAERVVVAREAQSVWARYSLSERVARLRALWSAVDRSRERLLRVIREETGAGLAEIEALEFCGAELALKYFTRHAHRALKDRPAARPWILFNKRAFVRHLPRGVVGVITPPSLPFLLPFADSVGALVAGNAALVKPSEWTARTALLLEHEAVSSGLFPEGLFQVLPGGVGTGEALVREADMVVFTGSAPSGRRVAKAAAERLIPAVLELGGKHPMIVLKDAPLERAARAAVQGGFSHCGQLCVGVERVLVEEPLYRDFSEAVASLMRGLRQSPEAGYDAELGRLARPERLERVEAHLEDARRLGARVSGGEVLDRERLLIRPALVLDATAGMRVWHEETFGPVLAVMPTRGAEEAVRLANETPYGLTASVWSGDLARAEALSAYVEAGFVGVNDLPSHHLVCSLPFGGFKESGPGRRYSDDGLRMFCQTQSVLVHEWPARAPEPWWFPYGPGKARWLRLLSRSA